MIKITRDCTCDKCGEKITDIFYTLTCYAADLDPNITNPSREVSMHNFRQNMALNGEERHLCKTCKDAITDGVFIV